MRISDWSSDVCSSDLRRLAQRLHGGALARVHLDGEADVAVLDDQARNHAQADDVAALRGVLHRLQGVEQGGFADHSHSLKTPRSEDHTSELQSLMRISYAVFCLSQTNSLAICAEPWLIAT